jgi:AcrR family transcriptional regulator
MRVMARVGPAELTLADIAQEAGLTAGALVQRFGSKRQLLINLSELLGSGMGDFFAQLRAKYDDPLEVVRQYASAMAGMARTPADLLRNFAYLQEDMADEALRVRFVAQSKSVNRELRASVRDAIKRGDLREETDATALVRNIEALISGALLTWAFHRQGTAESWVLRHIDALLAPHRTR